jgi:hypothetical protein
VLGSIVDDPTPGLEMKRPIVGGVVRTEEHDLALGHRARRLDLRQRAITDATSSFAFASNRGSPKER